MSEPLLTVALGCMIQTSATTLKGTEGAWVEVTTHEIRATPACRDVTVVTPREASMDALTAHTVTPRGKRRIGTERYDSRTAHIDGRTEVTLFVPELVAGDRLTLQVRRLWHTPGYRWHPAQLGSHPASLKAPKDVPWMWGDGSGSPPGAVLHLPKPTASDVVVIGADMTTTPVPLPSSPPQEHWQRTIRAPKGDPQVSLFPGGGSSVAVQGELVFPPRDTARAWVIPARPGYADLIARITPDPAATVEAREGALHIHLEPSEIRTQVWLAWTEPDAPTFGHLDPEGDTEIRAEEGVIQWEPSAHKWWLQAIHGRPVMPHSQTLLAALERRFLNATLKEPALPSHLRGAHPDVAVAEALTRYLRNSVVESTWPHEATLPRPVTRALRSGAASPTEGALALKALLAQANIDSQWVLIHPAPAGPGGKISLAGYTHMLLELEVDGTPLWIDPLCSVCDLFEVRPDLQGASALGPTTRGAPVTVGLLEASFTPDLARWTFSGSAATHLRLAWAALSVNERNAWLTANYWPEATVRVATGLDQPGAPVVLEMTDGQGAPYDPLLLPAVRTSDDSAWLPWVGTRRVTRAGVFEAASGEEGPLMWSRSTDGHTTTEVLSNTTRWLPGAAVRSIAHTRNPASLRSPEALP